MNTGGIQDVGTIGSWTPSRLTRYIQNEMNLRQRDAKTSLSADELFAHNNLTFSSGDFQTADTKVTRPSTGVLAINNIPIVMSASPVTSVFGRTGAVVAASGDYTAAQVTNAADKASSSNQAFIGGKLSSQYGNGLTGGSSNPSWSIVDTGNHEAFISVALAGGFASFLANQPGDSGWRWYVDSDGRTQWGSGTGGTDTNLYRASSNTLKTDSWFITGNAITSAGGNTGPGQGAILQGGNTYNAGNNWMTGMVAGNLYWDGGSTWINKTYGGNNGWGLIGFGGANNPGEINFYSDGATGGANRNYTAAQIQALRSHRFLSDGTLYANGRVYSGAPSTGGIWVDGLTSSQFMGSNSSTQMGWYNNGWWLLMNTGGDLRLQGTYGLTTGAGVGGTASAAATSVTLNKISGQVTFTGQSNTANVPKAFTVTNSFCGANDVVVVNMNSATGAAGTFVTSAFANAGSFSITTISNTANAAVTYSFNFWIMKSTNT